MKIASTLFLIASFAMMLYINIGLVAGVSTGIEGAKQEAATRISQGDVSSTITVDEKDFASGTVRMTGQSEISYQGKLYDIAAISQVNGKVILKVLHDEKEEGLLSDLKEVVESWSDNPAKNGTKQPSLKQIVILKDFVPTAKYVFNCERPFAQVSNTFLCTFHIESPLIAVLKSPPQLG